jgi:predicted acyltransferase (DUF342 family)
MEITTKVLERLGACDTGIKCFREHFLRGRAQYPAVLDKCIEIGEPGYAEWLITTIPGSTGEITRIPESQTEVNHLYVTGDLEVDSLRVAGDVFVAGKLTAKKLNVMGKLYVGEEAQIETSLVVHDSISVVKRLVVGEKLISGGWIIAEMIIAKAIQSNLEITAKHHIEAYKGGISARSHILSKEGHINAYGRIESKETICAKGPIYGHEIEAVVDLRSNDCIYSRGDITVGGDIDAGTSIRVEGSITSTCGVIRAGKSIQASGRIRSQHAVLAGTLTRTADMEKKAFVTAIERPNNLMFGVWREEKR